MSTTSRIVPLVLHPMSLCRLRELKYASGLEVRMWRSRSTECYVSISGFPYGVISRWKLSCLVFPSQGQNADVGRTSAVDASEGLSAPNQTRSREGDLSGHLIRCAAKGRLFAALVGIICIDSKAVVGDLISLDIIFPAAHQAYGMLIVNAAWLVVTYTKNATLVARFIYAILLNAVELALSAAKSHRRGQFGEQIAIQLSCCYGIYGTTIVACQAVHRVSEVRETEVDALGSSQVTTLDSARAVMVKMATIAKRTRSPIRPMYNMQTSYAADSDLGEGISSPPETLDRSRNSRACHRCRDFKAKCEPNSSNKDKCKKCDEDRASTIGFSHCKRAFVRSHEKSAVEQRRGPPKGYLHAIERRLHLVECLLSAIVTSQDIRAKGVVAALMKDPLARKILTEIQESGSHIPTERHEQVGIASHNLVSPGPYPRFDDTRKQTRQERESFVYKERLVKTLPMAEWHDNLSVTLSSSTCQPIENTKTPAISLVPVLGADPQLTTPEEFALLENLSDTRQCTYLLSTNVFPVASAPEQTALTAYSLKRVHDIDNSNDVEQSSRKRRRIVVDAKKLNTQMVHGTRPDTVDFKSSEDAMNNLLLHMSEENAPDPFLKIPPSDDFRLDMYLDQMKEQSPVWFTPWLLSANGFLLTLVGIDPDQSSATENWLMDY
ncbi:uncharacterized protein LAESUDRAFT_717322 [Laetiporus sulphureus 93-53]|uniref:Zn(2)-C6 fungal-type domain-containing protein n=1 Tax=Laetiporus sulphureus 93-53 TaxID=1314785 RepID=A0A165BVX0_9APHY|nr:uncharacterized protein LAESUDRAFT_717322 [Laetiporus sulphureus 93-53]KZT01747.1 hypothetical protein LAESUDRAFT_717322 [Laetiporus sulphureus 93-53]